MLAVYLCSRSRYGFTTGISILYLKGVMEILVLHGGDPVVNGKFLTFSQSLYRVTCVEHMNTD